MVAVHDYEKRYAEAFTITKIRTFKHEPFFIIGGEGGGLFVVYVLSMDYSLDLYELESIDLQTCEAFQTRHSLMQRLLFLS